jgi:hypothetical protein
VQANGVQVFGPLHHIALIVASFAAFCSQIRSQMSRAAASSRSQFRGSQIACRGRGCNKAANGPLSLRRHEGTLDDSVLGQRLVIGRGRS